MKEFKGTPGSWSLDDFDNVVHGSENGWGRKESVRVSGVSLPGRVTEEYAANTRLVSAAPDLLEALRRIEVSVNTIRYCWEKRPENMCMAMRQAEIDCESARAAISKALGEE